MKSVHQTVFKSCVLSMVCALSVGAAGANGGDIVLLGSTSSTTLCIATDVQAYLVASGAFATVDFIDVGTSTPALATLMQYDAAFVYSRVPFQDNAVLGDVLADYIDGGGGVVVAESSIAGFTPGVVLQGRWNTGGYQVIPTGGGNVTSPAMLGTVAQPGHPLMAGVTTFSAAFALRNSATTVQQGSVVAYWSDGSVLAAVGGTHPRRVDLGLYPPSSNCTPTYWNATSTDGVQLIVNALCYVAGGGTLGANYCVAAPNSTGATGAMSATGSSVVVDNDFHLVASDLPLNTFGFFLRSQVQSYVLNPGGSHGHLCLGGAIGRFQMQVQNSGALGSFTIQADLTDFPTPAGVPMAVQPGDTWNFQAWHRDTDGMGNATSNFTDGLEVAFH